MMTMMNANAFAATATTTATPAAAACAPATVVVTTTTAVTTPTTTGEDEHSAALMRMMSGLVSCTGAPFERRESAVFTVPRFMGRENVRMQFVSWYTLTFKDERHMCALALYEHIEGQEEEGKGCKHLWTTYTTTCDPFGHDNFTAPVGRRLLEHTRALRGTKRDDGFFILAENVLTYLTPACKTIEQRVFFRRKGIGHMIALRLPKSHHSSCSPRY